jgi:hypothetical protein
MDLDGDDILEKLILEGAVEVAGIDSETGEALFTFTDRLEEIAPDIFRNLMENFHKDIMDLWADGFLEMDLESDTPLVRLTEKAFDDDAISKLDRQQKLNLQEIISALRID